MGGKRAPNSPIDRLRPVLETIPLFTGLGDEDVSRIGEAARMQRYDANAVIIERGDPADALYAIAQGRLKVVRPRPGGRDATLVILGPGEVFGEIAMFSDNADGRSARVTALKESVVMTIDGRTFMDIVERSRVLSQRLLTLLANRLRDTNVHFDDMTSLEVPHRLAKKLLLLAERFGVSTDDGIGITLKLSQQELGDLVDTTRQTVNRHLRAWTEAGVIRTDAGQLVIVDPDALRERADRLHEA